MRHLPLIALVILPLIALPAMVIANSEPAQSGPVLVISAWGADAEGHIIAAGGREIGPLRAPFGRFATSEDADFPDRLRAAGAIAVINGARLAALCGVEL